MDGKSRLHGWAKECSHQAKKTVSYLQRGCSSATYEQELGMHCAKGYLLCGGTNDIRKR